MITQYSSNTKMNPMEIYEWDHASLQNENLMLHNYLTSHCVCSPSKSKSRCMIWDSSTRKEQSKKTLINIYKEERSLYETSQRNILKNLLSLSVYLCLCSLLSGPPPYLFCICSPNPSLYLWSQLSVHWLYTLCLVTDSLCSTVLWLTLCICVLTDLLSAYTQG